MPNKSRLRGFICKQHGKCAQGLFKFASQHLYHIHWSLPSQLSWEKSLLLTCKTLGLLVNTLPAHDKYLVLNRHNLTIPIQIQLPQKQETFFKFSLTFGNVAEILNDWRKKITLISFVFPLLRTPKTWLDKRLKSLV